MEIVFRPTPLQHKAWIYLQDKTTNFCLFGGSAGSGKSFLGCYWVFLSCLQFPGIRCLIGRSRLNNLKKTTLNTLLDVFKNNKFNDFNLNNITSTITFSNGSEIILMDLYPYPNDVNYDRLGSLEITLAFIDELSEIPWKGFQVLSSRLRYKLNEYNLIPKLFCASNPTNSWAKNYFYTPFIENKEKDNVKFIQAFSSDNPYLPPSYLDVMKKTLDPVLKRRLLYGDWSFESDEYNLFEYEKLQQTFYNEYFENLDETMYITVDVGDLGNDKTVIALWKGWNCIRLFKMEKKETTEVVAEINRIRILYKVNIANIIIDSVGVGAGVASLLKGCVRYAGSERALNGEKFKNIKSQLMYKFADMINTDRVNFNFSYDDLLVQEALLYKKEFKDDVAFVTGKDDIKRKLGRSPDMIDSLYLRSYWEFKKQFKMTYSIVR